ncbi:hypothetical protein M3J09_010987 [Ascochyta lentis]
MSLCSPLSCMDTKATQPDLDFRGNAWAGVLKALQTSFCARDCSQKHLLQQANL